MTGHFNSTHLTFKPAAFPRFTEMPTNHFVESSFWNFDALFQPQQHPSRDMHDTFFLSDPASDDKVPQDYLDRVAKVHSKGGYGSVGYGYEWDKAESEKLILRTHTTARSSYMLYQLAQEVGSSKARARLNDYSGS